MDPATMTGLELMQAMLDGAIPPPSIASTIPMQGVSVASGKVVFQARADERHLNPLGAVHGGFAATGQPSDVPPSARQSNPAGMRTLIRRWG